MDTAPASAPPGRTRRAAQVAALVLVAAFFVFAVVSQWSKIPDIRWRFEPAWLAVAVALFLVFQAAQAELWRLLLGDLGAPIDPARARAIWNVSLLGRYVPTNALMVVGRVTMSEKEGVPRRVCIASVVYELSLALVAAVAIGAYAVIRLSHTGGAARYLVLAIPAVGLAAMHPAIFHRVADRLLARMGRESLPVSLPFGRVLLYAAGYAAVFLDAGVALWAFARALHPLGVGALPTMLAAFAAGWASSVIGFILPAGLGVREAGLTGVISTTLPFTVALAVSVAVRLLQTGIELLFALVTPLLARRRAA